MKNDTYVCQSGFTVIDVGNHGHIPDVELVVHDGPHLLGGKVYLSNEEKFNESNIWDIDFDSLITSNEDRWYFGNHDIPF